MRFTHIDQATSVPTQSLYTFHAREVTDLIALSVPDYRTQSASRRCAIGVISACWPARIRFAISRCFVGGRAAASDLLVEADLRAGRSPRATCGCEHHLRVRSKFAERFDADLACPLGGQTPIRFSPHAVSDLLRPCRLIERRASRSSWTLGAGCAGRDDGVHNGERGDEIKRVSGSDACETSCIVTDGRDLGARCGRQACAEVCFGPTRRGKPHIRSVTVQMELDTCRASEAMHGDHPHVSARRAPALTHW